MKVQEVMARGTLDAAAGLERAFAAMPADRQTWRPLDEGRSALDQVAECAVINAWGSQVFRDHAVPPWDGGAYQRECAALDSAEKAITAVRASAKTLARAIEAVPDESLGIQVKFPWDENSSSLADAMLMAYWNMVYHIGQINYVQTLYGDKEMH